MPPENPPLDSSHTSRASGLSDGRSLRAASLNQPPHLDNPPVEFWENRLEVPVRRIIEDARAPGFLSAWLRRRTARQAAVLYHLLGVPAGSARERRKALQAREAELLPFVPAADFAMRKSMHAALDVARECLRSDEFDIARDEHDKYDTTALIFAILHRSARDLEKVFHLDKLHKVGFARMRLAKPPRRPPARFSDFLKSHEVPALLQRYDAEQGDRHVSELLQVIDLSDSQLVFIRRPHQKEHILVDERVVHGFTPDAIVLDFRSEGARLNVASHGHAASFEIANRIVSAFYAQALRYEDVTEISHEAQILRFLALLRSDQARDLRLVELRVQNSPLHGAPIIDISNKDNLSIGPALAQMEQAFSWTLDDVGRIPRFKVLFNDKRVSMEIDLIGNGRSEERTFVLRYRDQSLTLGERQVFETLIEQDHGIKVVSTEKRGARARTG